MSKFVRTEYPREIAEKLYELAKDMDYMDYEEEKEQILADLEDALYDLLAIAQNEYNKDCYRTMYNVLERLV